MPLDKPPPREEGQRDDDYRGQGFDDHDDYDDFDDQHRQMRRDMLPHRGGLILGLGIVSVIAGVLAIGCPFLPLVSIPLGLAAWLMGQGDLRKMRNGEMDPDALGKLRVEYTGSDAEYFALKHYRVGDRLVLGGVSGRAVAVGEGVWKQTNLAGLETTLERGDYPGVVATERTIRLPRMCGDETGHAREEITDAQTQACPA